MVTGALLGWSLLVGAFSDEPKNTSKVDAPAGTSPAPEKPSEKGERAAPADAAQQAEALAKYNELKARAKNTVEAQWRLALWCEKNGLSTEAYVHLANVVRLDPNRVAAWKKLGFRKHNGHWMTEEQIKEDGEQTKADQVWGPRLADLHRRYHQPARQQQALEDLAKIDDVRAVPSIFRELATGGPIDQSLAIQLLGQIKGRLASKALAALAVYGASPDVRRRATESLRSREPAEFVADLIRLLTDPLKFEVRAVGGPGVPGVLFVEGEQFNVRRFYAPPLPPNLVVRPGDYVSYDAFGLPMILRNGSSVPGAPSFTVGGSQQIKASSRLAIALGPQATGAIKQAFTPGAGSGPIQFTPTYVMQYSVSQNILQAQQAAASAQAQLESDVAAIKEVNKVRQSFNDLVVNVLKDATGENPGDTAKDWKQWLAQNLKYAQNPVKSPQKPTLNQLVPLIYNPPFRELTIRLVPGKPDA